LYAVDLANDLALALSPDLLFEKCVGSSPDPWQSAVIDDGDWKKLLLNITRQGGKSTVGGVLALKEFLFNPGSTTVILSPSLRQSGDILRRVNHFYHRVSDAPLTAESATRLESQTGSSILSLPASEQTIRGVPRVSLLILDECARIPRELIAAARPMQAIAKGARVLGMSTPDGMANYFADQWHKGIGWKRLQVTADDVTRISREFLAEQLAELGPQIFEQEFRGSFLTYASGQMFPTQLVEAAFDDASVIPLFKPRSLDA
jgi:hypothetical protein